MTAPAEPLVHVVVPFFGDASYLKEAVLSVLAQTDERWKLTVVEDGDHGAGIDEWIDGLGDHRVLHELNVRRLGVAANFQRCLELADCDLVVFLGCDDRLRPDYVATVLQHAAARRPAAVMPGVSVIDETGRQRRAMADLVKLLAGGNARRCPEALGGDAVLASLMRGNWTYFPSIAWRTEVIKPLGFRQDLPTTLDLELLSRVLLAGHLVRVVPRPKVFEYRRHSRSASSLTASHLGRFEEERRLCREIGERAGSQGWDRTRRAARWHVTSRLHAALALLVRPRDLDRARMRTVVRHTLGRL